MPIESDVASKNWRAYNRAKDNGHLKFVELAKKCDRFYKGDQWKKEDIDALEGRPALTINMILTTVNIILGEQSAKQAMTTAKPRRNGTPEIAEVLTKLFIHVNNENAFNESEAAVFADGVITGRGYFDIRMDFDENLQGEIRITTLEAGDVLLDPEAKEYDPKYWNEVITTRWMTLDDISLLYGKDKVDKIKDIPADGESYGEDSMQRTKFGTEIGPDYVLDGDRPVQKVRVIERQYRKPHKQMFMVEPTTGEMKPAPQSWDFEKVQEFTERNGLLLHTKLAKKIRWTVSADKVLLHDEWSPYKEFTVVPYFCYFRRGQPFGVVENLLSPQEQLNKVASQELHVVNTTANSGWVVEAGSLVNMTIDRLEEVGAQTGLVIEYAKGAQPPEKIKPNPVPTGLDRIGSKALENLKEISGVSDSMRGQDGNEATGVAITQKQQRGQVQVQVAFDNLTRTRRILAERVLELLQDYYTEHRLVSITHHNSLDQTEEEVNINQPTPEGIIANDITTGEYDVVVSSTPARDTYLENQFVQAMELKNAGVAIPDHHIVQNSNLQDKTEIAKEIRQMQGLGELTPEQQEQAQLEQQMLQLQVKELGAKVEKLMADAQLSQAKAQDLTQIQPELKSRELEGDLQAQADRVDMQMAIKKAELAAADGGNEGEQELIQMKLQAEMQKIQMELEAKREELAMKREEMEMNLRMKEAQMGQDQRANDMKMEQDRQSKEMEMSHREVGMNQEQRSGEMKLKHQEQAAKTKRQGETKNANTKPKPK